jgi:hypothetical protein
MFVGSDDGEEGVGEHGKGDPAAPGRVAADQVFIEPGQGLLGLEGLVDPPPGAATFTRVCSGAGLVERQR